MQNPNRINLKSDRIFNEIALKIFFRDYDLSTISSSMKAYSIIKTLKFMNQIKIVMNKKNKL